MKEKEGGREEIRDYYETHEISMETAVPHNDILHEGAEDSPAMTGESKEETEYNDYEGEPNDNSKEKY